MVVITWSEEATRQFAAIPLTDNQRDSFEVRFKRWVDEHAPDWRNNGKYRGEIDVGALEPVAVNVTVQDRQGDRFVVVTSVYLDT